MSFRNNVLAVVEAYNSNLTECNKSYSYEQLVEFAECLKINSNIGTEVIFFGNEMTLRLWRVEQVGCKKIPEFTINFTIYPSFLENNISQYVHFREVPKIIPITHFSVFLMELLENIHFLRWYGLFIKDASLYASMALRDELGVFGETFVARFRNRAKSLKVP